VHALLGICLAGKPASFGERLHIFKHSSLTLALPQNRYLHQRAYSDFATKGPDTLLDGQALFDICSKCAVTRHLAWPVLPSSPRGCGIQAKEATRLGHDEGVAQRVGAVGGRIQRRHPPAHLRVRHVQQHLGWILEQSL